MMIGVHSNIRKDPGYDVREKVLGCCRDLGVGAEVFCRGNRYDYIVSIGGDGTILGIAEECALSDTPILGINMGSVGFLTEVELSGVENALKKLLARDFLLERRALIEATLGEKRFHALNDIVLRSCDLHVVRMQVAVNGEVLDRFACDGYIASTPTGSTAYSLSAGGSVIGPNTPVIALTPVNAHTLRTRPIVVGSFEDIVLTDCGDTPVSIYADGKEVGVLEAGGEIKITGWDRSVLFVRFGKQSFYSRLLHKLNSWSAAEDTCSKE